ncbi:MAG: ABC transporter substrate-binding protein [Legionellaceae bacterium]|nr:ABC transporter substrate-binding protein [Legionellaceae bacterium]
MSIRIVLGALFALGLVILGVHQQRKVALPVVAIANYGAHASLNASIEGIKEALSAEGFKDKETVDIQLADVNFDLGLVPQMISQLKSKHPKVMVVVGTPIAQYAKSVEKTIPLVFTDITNPVASGLLETETEASGNMTGASDRQNLDLFLTFAKETITQLKGVGVLYATGEANDKALVDMLKAAGMSHQVDVVAIQVDKARDVSMIMQAFKDKVDVIYVGASGAIQPTLPAIVLEADSMGIPVFNVDKQAVFDKEVLASMGVDYYQVGMNTGRMVARILNGEHVSAIKPLFPTEQTHQGYISESRAKQYGVLIPKHAKSLKVVG